MHEQFFDRNCCHCRSGTQVHLKIFDLVADWQSSDPRQQNLAGTVGSSVIDSRFALLLSIAVLGDKRHRQSRTPLQLQPTCNIEFSDATVVGRECDGGLLDDARRYGTDQFVVELRHGFATGLRWLVRNYRQCRYGKTVHLSAAARDRTRRTVKTRRLLGAAGNFVRTRPLPFVPLRKGSGMLLPHVWEINDHDQMACIITNCFRLSFSFCL